MKLKRKHARLILGLMGLVLVLFLVLVVLELTSGASTAVMTVFSAVVIGLLVLVYVLRAKLLRCPVCKGSCAVPQWKPGKQHRCPRCKKPFVYDDEVVEPMKKRKKK